jgi:hypothetical protein
MPEIKVKYVCDTCESDDVVRDASVGWDIDSQTLVRRGDPMDAAYCEVCENGTTLREVAISEVES